MLDTRNNGNEKFENPADETRRPRRRKHKKNYSPQNKEDRDDRMVLNGIVKEALPGAWFHVKINNGDAIILATLSGKMRQNHIQILLGDKVIIEVSPYDMTRGRICRRL